MYMYMYWRSQQECSSVNHTIGSAMIIDSMLIVFTCSSQYPHAGKIDHTWVAYEWAHDCGLAHMTEILVGNLVDGRLLNTLSKDDIRKHLKLSKKTDQLSFLSAVELLRMHDFNRQVKLYTSSCTVRLTIYSYMLNMYIELTSDL